MTENSYRRYPEAPVGASSRTLRPFPCVLCSSAFDLLARAKAFNRKVRKGKAAKFAKNIWLSKLSVSSARNVGLELRDDVGGEAEQTLRGGVGSLAGEQRGDEADQAAITAVHLDGVGDQ